MQNANSQNANKFKYNWSHKKAIIDETSMPYRTSTILYIESGMVVLTTCQVQNYHYGTTVRPINLQPIPQKSVGAFTIYAFPTLERLTIGMLFKIFTLFHLFGWK